LPAPQFVFQVRRSIVALGIVLFFVPKINLVMVGGQSAGLRVDDVVLVGITGFLLLAVSHVRPLTISKLTLIFIAMICSFLLSNLLNAIIGRQSNVLYTFRMVEYFIFFYIGAYFRNNLKTLCYSLLAGNAMVMLLQAAGLVGGFASEGFSESLSDRPIGLTGGPWEVGAVINVIFAVLLFSDSKRSTLIFLLTAPLILLSGARTPLIAHVLVLLYFIYRRSRHKMTLIFRTGLVLAVVVATVSLIPNTLTQRSSNLLAQSNIEFAADLYRNIHIQEPFSGFTDVDVSGEGDMSWMLRANKWAYALKEWTETPSAWIIGLGPGKWGPSLDGGWLRLLTETGALGAGLFILFFSQMARTPMLRAVVLCLYVNMIFIDIHLAYKVMSLIFFIAGYSTQLAVVDSSARKIDPSRSGIDHSPRYTSSPPIT
jgi:hypothetical protein